jgi:spore maturation protein CgeB
MYYPEAREPSWDLGYMGTYSSDRQPSLERLMLEAARVCGDARMVVAGPQYPHDIRWPENVKRIEHLPPARHREFYNLQRFTLNITRADMMKAGYSPSVRLFEAAACATPIISDYWTGLEKFLEPGEDILVSHGVKDTLQYLQELTENERMAIGMRARERILGAHTAAHRAAELEAYAVELIGTSPGPERSVPLQAISEPV